MYAQNTGTPVVQASQLAISEVSPTVKRLFPVIFTSTLYTKYTLYTTIPGTMSSDKGRKWDSLDTQVWGRACL